MPEIIQIPLSRLKYFKSLGSAFEPNSQVEAMAADIKIQGVREPLIVRPVGDLYEVVCGLLRWKGAIVGGLESVPAEVRQLSDAQALELSMSDNRRPLDALDIHQDEYVVDPTPIVDVVRYTSTGPYKIDEPLGTGFCRLFESDFSPEDLRLLMKDSAIDASNLEADLAMFWDGLSKGRLHVEGRGDDCGEFLLTYIEAYFDIEEPDVAFCGPNTGIWDGLTGSERQEVVADANRLNPVVNAVLSVIYGFPDKAAKG